MSALLVAIAAVVTAAPSAGSQPPASAEPVTGFAFLETQRALAMRDALQVTDPLLAVGAFAHARALLEHVDDDGVGARFIEDAARKATSPLVRARARRARAADAAGRGDFAAADADLDTLGHPRALACIGPFANTGGASFDTPTPADDVAATFTAAVAGMDREVRWRVVPREARGGFDVGARFVSRREVRARCAAVLEVGAGTYALRTGSSGAIAVWVDGVEIVRRDVDRPFAFDQDAGAIALPRGKHLVVLEGAFLQRGGILDVRVTAPDGTPVWARWSVDVADVVAAGKSRAGTPTTVKPHVADVGAVLQDAAAALPALRAAAAAEATIRAQDTRARPAPLEVLLERLVAAASDPAEKAAALAQLGVERSGRDLSAARAVFEEALRLDPDAPGALAGLAALRHKQGDDLGASAWWQRVQRAAPTSALYRRDRLAFERERGVLGIVVDDEILTAARTSKDAGLLQLAADVLDDRGDHQGALSLLRRSGDAARVALHEGEMLEARLAVDASAMDRWIAGMRLRLRLAPGSHGLAERLLLRIVETEPAAAAAFVDERRALFPDRPEPLELQARLALIRGDRQRARDALAQALALTPEDGELQRAARALAADGDDALVTRYLPTFDDGAVERACTDIPAGGKALGAWTAERTLVTRFFNNGLLRSIEDVVVVIDDAEKAQELRAFSYGYSGGRERIDVLVAERVRADGRREPAERVVDRGRSGKENGAYSDARTTTVVFSSLARGDVVHVRVRREAVGLQNLFGDFFGDIEPLQGRFPTKRFRYVVEAPRERPLFHGGRGAPEPRVTERDDVRVYDFLANDIPGLDPEPDMPPWLEVARYLSVSTYASWGELGAWYEDLIREQLRLDDDLRRVARELRAAARDDADLVRRVYEYVVTSTRYVGIELGIHGWKPYPVSEVHRRRYGDCKDKASLLVALLREAGIDAHIALVRTIQLGHVGESPPSMWTFNHAIAYVPLLDLFLDGTAERSGWRELPTMDQGALSLIVDGKDSRLVTIPVAPADANLNTSSYVLTLTADGTLVVDGTERFRGSRNPEERRAFADPATWRVSLERMLAQSIIGAQVTGIEVSSLALDIEEISYRFQALLPKRATPQADGSLVMPVSLYPHDLVGSYAKASARRFELFVDHPWRTRNVMRYVLPPGVTPVDLPAGGSVDGRYIRFTQTITRTADGFIVDEDTALLARRVPVADYPRLRSEALAADALMKRTLRLRGARR